MLRVSISINKFNLVILYNFVHPQSIFMKTSFYIFKASSLFKEIFLRNGKMTKISFEVLTEFEFN